MACLCATGLQTFRSDAGGRPGVRVEVGTAKFRYYVLLSTSSETRAFPTPRQAPVFQLLADRAGRSIDSVAEDRRP